MGLFTNVGGQLKELNSLTITVGGEPKEINSLTANIGGQPKEIFTMLPKNITGTWHLTSGYSKHPAFYQQYYDYIAFDDIKLPINHKIKVKITITITDGYIYKKISSSKEQVHGVNVALGYITQLSNFATLAECGSEYYDETETTYTTETTFTNNVLDEKCILMNRWAGIMGNDGGTDFYANSLLSFDYSIEFELV